MITLTLAFVFTIIALIFMVGVAGRELHEQISWFKRVGHSELNPQIIAWAAESVAKRWSRTDIRSQLRAKSLRH